MRIKQKLNNNVVIATERGDEFVVMGTGLGFNKRVGDRIEDVKVNKTFILKKNGVVTKMEKFIRAIPPVYLEITEEIVVFAQREKDLHLKDSIFISLSDHLYNAVQQLKEGFVLENPLLPEIKRFYKTEYSIALAAGDIVKKRISIILPEDEIGFITFHIVESALQGNTANPKKITTLMKACLQTILEYTAVEIKQESVQYYRLISHLKWFAFRYISDEEERYQDTLIDETIMANFPRETECIDIVSDMLEDTYGKAMTQSEKNYLILHLRNVMRVQ